LESDFNLSVSRTFPAPISFNLLTSISLKQKLKQFFIENSQINLTVFIWIIILINIFRFKSLKLTSSKQIKSIFINLTEIILASHLSRMHITEMTIWDFDKMFWFSIVKLIKEKELMIPFQPHSANKIRRSAYFLVWAHFIFFSHEFVLFILFIEIFECLRIFNFTLFCSIRIECAHIAQISNGDSILLA